MNHEPQVSDFARGMHGIAMYHASHLSPTAPTAPQSPVLRNECQEAAAERRVCDGVRIVHESTMRSSHRRSGARILRSAPHLLQREADAMFLVPAPVAADGTGRFRVGSYRTVR